MAIFMVMLYISMLTCSYGANIDWPTTVQGIDVATPEETPAYTSPVPITPGIVYTTHDSTTRKVIANRTAIITSSSVTSSDTSEQHSTPESTSSSSTNVTPRSSSISSTITRTRSTATTLQSTSRIYPFTTVKPNVSKGVSPGCKRKCEQFLKSNKICASNGITYNTFCNHLEAQCMARINGVKMHYYKHDGECGSTATTTTIKTTTTKTTTTVHPSCDQRCHKYMQGSRVCATNGVTYDTFCKHVEAQCMAQRNGQKLHFYKHDGECIFTPEVPTTMSTTVVFKKTSIHSKCDKSCHKYMKGNKVCANNGITYESFCKHVEAQCVSKMTNQKMHYFRHDGECKKGSVGKLIIPEIVEIIG